MRLGQRLAAWYVTRRYGKEAGMWFQLLIRYAPPVLGFVGAVTTLHAQGLTIWSAIQAAAIAAFGLTVKPLNKTGGTIPSTAEAAARLGLPSSEVAKLPGTVPDALLDSKQVKP